MKTHNDPDVCRRLLSTDFEELDRTATVVARRYKSLCSWLNLDDLYQECWAIFGTAARSFDFKEGTRFAGYAQCAAYRGLKSFVLKASSPVPGSNMRAMAKARRVAIAGHQRVAENQPRSTGVDPSVPPPDFAMAQAHKLKHEALSYEIWRLIAVAAAQYELDKRALFDLVTKERKSAKVAEETGIDRKILNAVARKTRDMIASDPTVRKLWREA